MSLQVLLTAVEWNFLWKAFKSTIYEALFTSSSFLFLFCSTFVGTLDALKRLSVAPAHGQVTIQTIPTMFENITSAAPTNLTHVILPPNASATAATEAFHLSATKASSVMGLISSPPTLKTDTSAQTLASVGGNVSAAQTLANLGSQVVQHLMSKGGGNAAANVLMDKMAPGNVLFNSTTASPVPWISAWFRMVCRNEWVVSKWYH